MCRPKYGPERDIDREFRTDRQLRKLGIIKEPIHVTIFVIFLTVIFYPLWVAAKRK